MRLGIKSNKKWSGTKSNKKMNLDRELFSDLILEILLNSYFVLTIYIWYHKDNLNMMWIAPKSCLNFQDPSLAWIWFGSRTSYLTWFYNLNWDKLSVSVIIYNPWVDEGEGFDAERREERMLENGVGWAKQATWDISLNFSLSPLFLIGIDRK